MSPIFLRKTSYLMVLGTLLFLNLKGHAIENKSIVLQMAEEAYAEAKKQQIVSPFFSEMYKNVLKAQRFLEAQNKEFSGTFDDFKSTSLKEEYLDFLVFRYCRTHPNTLLFIAYPFAYGHNQAIQATLNKKKYGTVLYSKEITFTKEGAINLLYETYEAAGKLDENSPPNRRRKTEKGIHEKAKFSFHRYNHPMTLYVMKISKPKLLKAKKEIRGFTGGADRAVHSTDQHRESIAIASLLLNNNSIHHLNYMKRRDLPKFSRYVPRFKAALSKAGADPEHFCFEHGIVLAAYGLRDCGDIDYISLRDLDKYPSCNNLDCHNRRYPKSYTDNVISNPANHFYYKGLKFCSLKVLRRLKAGTRDQVLIDSVPKS